MKDLLWFILLLIVTVCFFNNHVKLAERPDDQTMAMFNYALVGEQQNIKDCMLKLTPQEQKDFYREHREKFLRKAALFGVKVQ